ncbi:large conductance mechanosensitive channel protein MscL [Olsenella sp. An270]|uniref:large conductance mechanosensitive channel protein MscL n=1 Tax=Olsenella sp. An270 TaxID=1965615 RepID=UPI000B3AEDB9|nr:large conductance mechanosensitive channel protein MscL [Olsenella sp. An270]OUO58840.1 mechanosensitive ion channel protein MscL [Olsenella sp. An270]
MKIVDEFKEFIARGNVMDMAVGIIVGGAFTAIVNSLVTSVITPGIHFLTAVTSSATGGAADGASDIITGLKWMVPGTDAAPEYIDLGAFIGAVINFLIIAFVVFCMVKGLNTMREKMDAIAKKDAEEEAAEEAAAPHCPFCLEEVKEGATRCPHCGAEIKAA